MVLENGADGRVTINKQPVPLADLQARLTTLYRDRQDKTAVRDGDGRLPYGSIVEAIDPAKGEAWTRSGSSRRACGGAEITVKSAGSLVQWYV